MHKLILYSKVQAPLSLAHSPHATHTLKRPDLVKNLHQICFPTWWIYQSTNNKEDGKI
jgi:hypothetical protein